MRLLTGGLHDMTELQLTPLGTSPAWYNPGEPTTGFLLEADGYRLLIDCGAGVISRYLQHFGGSAPIDAIVITHVHADHVVDLVPLKYGIQYGDLSAWKPRLLLPPGAHERLRRMVSAWDGPADFFEQTFEVEDYGVDSPFPVGPFSIESHEVPHFIEAFALRISTGAATFGYTSDLGPSKGAAEFMRGVDLLLCEATLPEDHDESPEHRGHLTGSEAGTIARDAGAHSLLLTHIPAEVGEDAAIAAARSTFDGPVAAAQALERYAIEQRLARAV